MQSLHFISFEKNYIYFRFLTTLIKLCQPLIYYIKLNGRYDIEINIRKRKLGPIGQILKNHYYYQFKTVSEIIGIDYPSINLRFKVVYVFLSYMNSLRLNISVNIKDRLSLNSLTNSFPGTGWLEREVWDFFGIYFKGNKDLRRILSDYGFRGYPLRKDFPLTGFYELLFDDNKQQVTYQPVSLAQEYRDFTIQNPWRLIY